VSHLLFSILEFLHLIWGVVLLVEVLVVWVIVTALDKRSLKLIALYAALLAFGVSIALSLPAALDGAYRDLDLIDGVFAHLGAVLDIFGWFVIGAFIVPLAAGLWYVVEKLNDARPQRTRGNRGL